MVQGLLAAGVLRGGSLAAAARLVPGFRPRPLALAGHGHGAGGACLATGMLGSFLRAPHLGYVFLAGMLTGFLPCGLVYAYLALATSSSSFIGGLATMAAFGLGTVPLMVLAGSGASLISLATRQRLYRLAAWCVVLTGLVSLARGVAFLEPLGPPAAASCPLCP